MSPIKYHGENKQPLQLRVTPTGVRMLHEKYIGPGKLADNVATLLEELAVGNIVAIPASVGQLFGMDDAESTIGTMITDLTHQLNQAKQTISDMDTIVQKDSTRPAYKAFEDLGLSGKRKRCALLESKVKDLCQDMGLPGDNTEMLEDFIERNKRSGPDEATEKIIWADNPGGITFQNTWSKMRELISNKQYHGLRKDNNLQHLLAPVHHVKELKKLGQQQTEEAMGIKTFSFTAEYPDEDPDITGTSVFFDAVIELAVELVQPWLKKNHRRLPPNLKFKITLDGRPLGGHDQVAVGLVPLIPGFKAQSSFSVLPLMIFNGKETFHNLKESLTGLAKDMERIKKDGIIFEGEKYSITYLLCVDMSSLWKISKGGQNAGDNFCTWCMCLKKDRHIFDNPEFQVLRTDLLCIFPVDLTQVVFCGLHARMRVVGKMLNKLGTSLHQHGKMDAVRKLIKAVKEEAGINAFNMSLVGQKIQATALIGGNCTKVLKAMGRIIDKVEIPSMKGFSHEIWSSLLWFDEAMRASAEDVTKTYTPAALKIHMDSLHLLTQAATRSSSRTSTRWAAAAHRTPAAAQRPSRKVLMASDINYYLHTILCHLPSMLDLHGALGYLSQEGFEASHKIQRQIYAKATNRDGGKWKGRTAATMILIHQYWLLLADVGRLTWESCQAIKAKNNTNANQ